MAHLSISAMAFSFQRRTRITTTTTMFLVGVVVLMTFCELFSTTQAFAPVLRATKKVPTTSTPSAYSSSFSLSVAQAPNVLRHQGDEMDDSSSWTSESSSSSSSSSFMDDYEDWRSFLSSYEGDEYHHSASTAGAASSMPVRGLTRRDKWSLGVASAAAASLFVAMLCLAGAGAWRYCLAGGVCAAVSHTVPVPIDVIKTRKQVDPDYCDLSMPAALRRLVAREGWAATWTGTGPTFWGYFFEGAVKFGVYEMLKPYMGIWLANQHHHHPASDGLLWLNYVACAAVSGCAAAFMLCPMEALRIRLVVAAKRPSEARGWWHAGARMVRREGLSGLTRGLVPMLCKQVPYTITKNVSFDFLTKTLYRRLGGAASLAVPLVSAAVASVLSCLSSQPGDMLLSLANAHEGERRRTRDWIRQIVHSDKGWAGFMVGVKTRLLHVGVIVTMQLLIYDFVKRLVGIAATGSV